MSKYCRAGSCGTIYEDEIIIDTNGDIMIQYLWLGEGVFLLKTSSEDKMYLKAVDEYVEQGSWSFEFS